MNRFDDGGKPRRLPLAPLRVWRVEAGTAAIVRILTAPDQKRVRGCFTHYLRKKSHYCHGDSCPAPLHRLGQIWKGYLGAEVYMQDLGHWQPIVLEVSERLELDFRGVIDRGQVWDLSRQPSHKGKHFPVSGILLEERDPNTFPAAFDLIPTLLHLYHLPAINLSFFNPLPGHTMVRPTEGDAPDVAKAAPTRPGGPQSDADREKAAKLLREYLDQRRGAKGWVPKGVDGVSNGNGHPAAPSPS